MSSQCLNPRIFKRSYSSIPDKPLRPLWRTSKGREPSQKLQNPNAALLSVNHPLVVRAREAYGLGPDWWKDWQPRYRAPIIGKKGRAVIYRNQARSNKKSRIFVASIGNPAPYERSLHSAGHILSDALADLLKAKPVKPVVRGPEGKCLTARLPGLDTRLTFWKSPTYMNTSGRALASDFLKWLRTQYQAPSVVVPAWKILRNPQNIEEFSTERKDAFRMGYKSDSLKKWCETPQVLKLILLHDELELPFGELSVKYGGLELSAKGHNGVKSVMSELCGIGMLMANSTKKNVKFPVLIRVGIGIGRPKERTQEAVSKFLLDPLSDQTLRGLKSLAPVLKACLERELQALEISKPLHGEVEELADDLPREVALA